MEAPTKEKPGEHWERKNPDKLVENFRDWITKEKDLMKLESAVRSFHKYLRSIRHEKEFKKVKDK